MIDSFKGEHRWLSNFWPVDVEMDGEVYSSVEHAYVAAKTLDLDIRKKIQQVPTPGEVKRLGRTFALRPDWDAVKLDVMSQLTWDKFQRPHLKANLLATGDVELIEGNTWGDVFWGMCRGVGENHLGKILMAHRTRLQGEE